MAHAIMVLGTASNVGKSWLATGLCALARRRGLAVAPFKAQNMSNNAAPARRADGSWGEIGRAQAAQAEAAGLEPHVDMNPILLKPSGERRSQVVLLGLAQRNHAADRYWAERDRYWELVTGAYGRLATGRDLVVLEGAGSPVELNLLARDLVNGRMAEHAVAAARAVGQDGSCLLVGDIDRGGIFASLSGTVRLMPDSLRAITRGIVVNRFRGDPALFADGPRLIEAHSGVPVRGVIPWRPDIAVDPEDGQDEVAGGSGPLDVCVLRLPTVANFEDLASLARLAPVRVRFETEPGAIGSPDLLVLPGAKNTLADLRWMRARGLDRVVVAAAGRGVPVIGLCGGYQLLGQTIADPEGLGGSPGVERALGLLPVQTELLADKQVRPASGRTAGGWLLPEGLPVGGYEIHQGRSQTASPPLVTLDAADGAVEGLVAGTYLHGLLDGPEVRRALIGALLERRGLPPWEGGLAGATAQRAAGYAQLADLLEAHLDLRGLLP